MKVVKVVMVKDKEISDSPCSEDESIFILTDCSSEIRYPPNRRLANIKCTYMPSMHIARIACDGDAAIMLQRSSSDSLLLLTPALVALFVAPKIWQIRLTHLLFSF